MNFSIHCDSGHSGNTFATKESGSTVGKGVCLGRDESHIYTFPCQLSSDTLRQVCGDSSLVRELVVCGGFPLAHFLP